MSAIIREPVTKKMLESQATRLVALAQLLEEPRTARTLRVGVAETLRIIAREQRAAVAEMEADK
jgi:hypothetical protein